MRTVRSDDWFHLLNTGQQALAWRLHPEAARDAFQTRALDTTLPLEQRRRAVDAIAFMTSQRAADTMLTLAQAGADDLRSYAAWWVRHRDQNDWRAYRLAEQLGSAGLEDAERVWSSDLLRAGLG